MPALSRKRERGVVRADARIQAKAAGGEGTVVEARFCHDHQVVPPAGLHRTIPALPVRNMSAAVAWYRERFGFEARHETDGFSVLVRDEAILHLWAASDESWRAREDLSQQPIRSGAESFLAGTASCRIEVEDVGALFDELSAARVLHSVSVAGVAVTDFGTKEFATVDLDNNALAFFSRENG